MAREGEGPGRSYRAEDFPRHVHVECIYLIITSGCPTSLMDGRTRKEEPATSQRAPWRDACQSVRRHRFAVKIHRSSLGWYFFNSRSKARMRPANASASA